MKNLIIELLEIGWVKLVIYYLVVSLSIILWTV